MNGEEFKVVKVSNKEEWEKAYAIRVQVFVKEQKVPQENELDELDPECLHWMVLTKDGNAVGTLRLYVDPLGKKGKLGRMAVLKEYRRRGIGKMLIQELVEHAKEFTDIQKIVCHAQQYIQDFYIYCGFTVESTEIFMEEGIPHVLMTRVI
jgi:predicted GNAT family N-acyltransferase